MAQGDLADGLRMLEKDLDLGSGFLIKLWGDPDPWSFVIKSHALLETALSDLLTSFLFNPKLQPVVDYLPIGGKAGKVAFLRATDLLTAAEQTFLDELQHLRNTLVHSVHNTRFDFATFLATNPDQARRLGVAASAFGNTSAVRKSNEARYQDDPRLTIWLAVLYVLAGSRSKLLKSDAERRTLEAHVQKLLGTK